MRKIKNTCIDCRFWQKCTNKNEACADDEVCEEFEIDADLVRQEDIIQTTNII